MVVLTEVASMEEAVDSMEEAVTTMEEVVITTEVDVVNKMLFYTHKKQMNELKKLFS